jgi:hypothetical protein
MQLIQAAEYRRRHFFGLRGDTLLAGRELLYKYPNLDFEAAHRIGKLQNTDCNSWVTGCINHRLEKD